MIAKTHRIGGDLEVPRLGFGAMRVCGPGVWGSHDDPEAQKDLLREVVALGIRLVDTADAYGPEVSEYLIAEALHPYPPDLVIATKGGLVRGGPGVWERDGRPEHLTRAIENSLRRLQRDHIDLYQLHAIDPEVPLEDSLGAIVRAKEQGKVRHVGVSNFDVAALDRAIAVTPVATVQNRYNLVDRTHEAVVDRCAELGIGFIPWFPLDTGKLADHAKLAALADKYEATATRLALAWLLHRAPVVLPIPGTSSIAHLRDNTKARDLALDPSDVDTLTALAAN